MIDFENCDLCDQLTFLIPREFVSSETELVLENSIEDFVEILSVRSYDVGWYAE